MNCVHHHCFTVTIIYSIFCQKLNADMNFFFITNTKTPRCGEVFFSFMQLTADIHIG